VNGFGARVASGDVSGDDASDLLIADELRFVRVFIAPPGGFVSALQADATVDLGDAGPATFLGAGMFATPSISLSVVSGGVGRAFASPLSGAIPADEAAVTLALDESEGVALVVEDLDGDSEADGIAVLASDTPGFSTVFVLQGPISSEDPASVWTAALEVESTTPRPTLIGRPSGDLVNWVLGSTDSLLLFQGMPSTEELMSAEEAAVARFDNADGGQIDAFGAYAGDIDGDGDDEVLASFATWSPGDNVPEAGLVTVFFGDEFLGVRTTDDADVRIEGLASERLGRSVGGGCDLDGDGRADLLIGAHREVDGEDSGVVLGFYGESTGGESSSEDAAFEVAGASGAEAWQVTCVGDVGGDGRDDFTVAAPGLEAVQQVSLFAGTSW
jgi:hypothetical protein